MARDLDSGASPEDKARERGELPVDATKEHNVEHRREQLRKAHSEISALEREVDSLRAQVKAKNKLIADKFRKVKSDTGITRENFEITRGLLKLEDDEHDEALDQIRETYEALKPGEQLDWLGATSAPAASNGAPQPVH